VAAGAAVNDATPEGRTALIVASANGQEELGKFLLDKGANPNAADSNGITALHYTVLRGLSMVRAVSYHPYLAYLYRPNLVELAKALLAHGANPNARLVNSPEIPYFAFGVNPIGSTPFLLAATTNDLEIMHAMIAAGADAKIPTQEGMTPLMAAQIVDRAAGGTTTGRADAGTKEQETRTNQAVKMIAEAGADVNAANNLGQTALHFAANRGLDQVVQYLVAQGAKVDAKDKYGQTALNIAARVRPAGVQERAMARLGGTPNNLAHKSTADLLVSLGATPLPGAPAKRSGPPTGQ
jgi:ankyrin repeat protein